MIRAALICAAVLAPLPLTGMELEFPGLSTLIGEQRTENDSVFLPDAAYVSGPIDGLSAEGTVSLQSWRVDAPGMTTLQLLAPLRDQLTQAGYRALFECAAKVCGGFDFRYQLDVLPEPQMHVNLGDFRYLLAEKPGADGPDYAALVVSRSANAGFVQLTRVGASAIAPATVTTSTKALPTLTINPGPVGEQLETAGHASLDDLNFKTGKSELADQDFASLTSLAAYLATRPDRQIVLVGHTDSEGALAANILLSKRRAGAVMRRLVDTYGVRPAQVSADGVGFLSPIASNLTPEGRAQNRRVEVILTSTE